MATFVAYLFIIMVLANRYFFGLYLRLIKGKRFDETVDGYEPTVEIVIPLYNEGRSIYDTIMSLLEQDYPPEKLHITVVDDCSVDDSYDWARRAAQRHPNVTVLRNPRNMGKRKGINRAVRRSRSEIIVSVDSDVLVERDAVRKLVARFTGPRIAAVGGRVNISNPNDNWLTKMQTVKYYFGYVFLKNLERSCKSVMCLSGCLTAYRREVLLELEPILEHRNVCGVPIKYGEDRFLTRQIVKAGYQTVLTLDAACATKAPARLGGYFNQQLRWKRSNIIDFFCGLSHAWKLHPLVTIHYLTLFAVLMVYPCVLTYGLLSGVFWSLAALHLAVVGALGLVYHLDCIRRAVPESRRVHPLYFIPMAVLLPAAYLLLTPLALFTLDSGSWETRKAQSTGSRT